MKNYSFAVLLALFISACVQNNPDTITRLQNHIKYLASDELEGREAGSEGEKKAAKYLAEQFEEMGLSPKGDGNSFDQEFEFLAGKNVQGTFLRIGGNEIDGNEYFPMNFSGNGSASGEGINVNFGIKADELSYNDYQGIDPTGKIAWINISSPDGIHPHSQYLKYHDLKERARVAQELGASAIVFYNNDDTASDPQTNYTDNVTALDIPVIFYKVSEMQTESMEVNVSLVEDQRIARNVISYLDNSADTDIIIGAHFDHLGYGQAGSSLYRGDQVQIHNGADDNASGTALLVELARDIKNSDLKNHNFLFIAFSGEEKGLLGANYFVENPTIDLDRVAYMINMDMVGRLDTADHQLAINGVGTSPAWDAVLEDINNTYFDIQTSESGVGPSDHTSFYLADIPVLHFFTGTHEDYHKPSDDSDKINYEGMIEVKNLIMAMNTKLNDSARIVFTKTQDSQARSAPRFSVTLGVVPDYMYSEGGLKIDGVTEGKPAAIAGIEAGDIIIQMGDLTIDDIYGYMNALSMYKKGDKIEVVYLRDGNKSTTEVEF